MLISTFLLKINRYQVAELAEAFFKPDKFRQNQVTLVNLLKSTI